MSQNYVIKLIRKKLWVQVGGFGRPFVKWLALCYQTVVCLSCPVLSCLSVTFVHCGQTVGRIKMKLGTQVGPWPHYVRWGPSPPPPKGHSSPIFGPYLLRPSGCSDQDVTWYGARPRPRRLYVRWGARSHEGGRAPQIFGPCLLWSNGWMDEAGTWHGGRPQPRRLFVRWGPSTPPPKGGGAFSPIFGPFLLWPNGWMHHDAT